LLQESLEITAPVFEGLQVILALDCHLRCRVNDSLPFNIREPGIYITLAFGQHEGYDHFSANTPQRFVKTGINPEDAERNGIDLAGLAQSPCRRMFNGDIMCLYHPLTPALKAIATQVLMYPVQGAMRDLYLAGKCLELMALTTATLSCQRNSRHHSLSGADLKRLWQARELALQHYQHPLTLHALAREVGTNVNKLTADFRQVFGLSVFEYVQHHRLQEARHMLATGTCSVSEAAACVGYTLPHFSTLFRKHFGMAPSRLNG